MYCVMCRYSGGATELVDTYPSRSAAEEARDLQISYHQFLTTAGLHTKPRTYYVEEEKPKRKRR